MAKKFDLKITTHGSTFLLTGNTKKGWDWISDNFDFAQWVAGSVVVEQRFIKDVIVGAAESGLGIEGPIVMRSGAIIQSIGPPSDGLA